ncbi:MAG TPA: S9 family peptidase [Aeromicrobium sp.]|nr:S9 family peptidase [Aeromicrobium sp.]HKY57740.1 S9 family peptidase [Aeromicrobium sp.]
MTDHSPDATPPVAPRKPTTRVHHGDTFVDDYEWLRDADNPETLAYLEAENAWADQQTAHLDELRETIFAEIKARTQETDLSVPVRHGQWWYYSRTVEGQQYALRCRCPLDHPDDWDPPVLTPGVDVPGEQVLLDSNVEAEGHGYFSLGGFSLTDDDNLLAWSVDTVGDERYTIRVKDLTTGTVLPDEIFGTSGGITWAADGRHFFYTTVDAAWRPHRVWRHELGKEHPGGAPDLADTLVYEEDDERFFTGIGRTRSDRYLAIGSSSKVTSEVRILEADDPTGEFRVVWPRETGVEYSVEHAVINGHDEFLILHNRDAINFTLQSVPAAGPYDHPTTVIPHDQSTRLEDVDVFAKQVMVQYRRDAMPRVGIMRIGAEGLGPLQEISFDEELISCGVGANAEWDQPLVRLGYGSFITPATVVDYVVETGELRQRKQAVVLGGYDPADYEQHRIWAKGEDGERVPISVVCKVGTPRDGSAPALLYGYGSYESSIDPGLSISRLSLLDRGFVFAVAHVRGGGEMGRRWYEDGKLLRKKNTFTDFVAAARHLVAEGWTSADRLVAEGGSAGGLLMGAVANLAPDDFAGILASVPFVDALTSILDPALPLTVIEWDEWGNPLENEDVYRYMKSYSPYENVTATRYPDILAVTSLHDTRVLYVEPAKWIARLRATATGNFLLKTEMSAGHGGVSGRYAAWRERAWELAWIIDVGQRKISTR